MLNRAHTQLLVQKAVTCHATKDQTASKQFWYQPVQYFTSQSKDCHRYTNSNRDQALRFTDVDATAAALVFQFMNDLR